MRDNRPRVVLRGEDRDGPGRSDAQASPLLGLGFGFVVAQD